MASTEWISSAPGISPASSCAISERPDKSAPIASSLGRPQRNTHNAGRHSKCEPSPIAHSEISQPHCRARAERRALLHNSKLSLHSRPSEFGLNKVCGLFHLPTRHSISLERRSKRASTLDIRVDKRHSLRSFHLPIAPGQERTSKKLQ